MCRIRLVAAGISVGVALLASAAIVDDFAPDYAKAEGSWAVIEMEMDGQAVPEAGFRDMQIVLKGNSLVARNKKDTIAEGTYTIASVKGKLVAFDLTITTGGDKGKVFPALNEWVDDDTIRTVLLPPAKERPTGEAKPQKGDGAAVFVIRRLKKE